jgi:hypothetical protein
MLFSLVLLSGASVQVLGVVVSHQLTPAEMGALTGTGCGDSAGGMLAAGLVSGLFWAPVPVFGQIMLAIAAGYGVFVLVTC